MINWYVKPDTTLNKDIVLVRYKRYLSGMGLQDEILKLHIRRVNAFWIMRGFICLM